MAFDGPDKIALQFRNRLRIFISLPLREKLLFFEALLFLFLAKIMLLVLPFRICMRTIKTVKYDNNPDTVVIKSLKDAIERAGRFAFWKNVCLGQSFAGRWMLQRRGIASLFMIGVRHDDQKKLKAHAWLTAGGIEIVPGGEVYTTLTAY